MSSNAALNRNYRLVRSRAENTWTPVAETTRGHGQKTRRTLAVALLSLFPAITRAAPAGGEVTAGSGSIVQSGATTTIRQSSQNLSLSWQSFNIAPQETVNFVQPSAAAVAVNRIVDTNGTQILGHLNANGQVYLINPNGILFGAGAQVNVGGLVASTLEVGDNDLQGGRRRFSGSSAAGVVNRGAIAAAEGGYVALLGTHVENQGSIVARLGTVALGAGSAVTLTFNGDSLVNMQVDRNVMVSLAENGGLIQADGGLVAMSAGAKDSLLASVVNNTGVIEARTVENRGGDIVLLGGMAAGAVNVSGGLDASAPGGGDGGFIETSAEHVKVADDARVTTAAAAGKNGTWLIDPVDFTIAASGGDMTGAAVSTALAGGNFTVQSSSGSAGTAGDIHVDDAVNWSANTLTLSAWNDIHIDAHLAGSGSAGLALAYGQGAAAAGNAANYYVGDAVELPAGPYFSTKLGMDGTVVNYTVITGLGAAGSTTAADLQGMNGNRSGNYALGTDIDAVATTSWNSGAGFTPVGNAATPFTGNFAGLGHAISGLTINRPSTTYIGLFGFTELGSTVRNVGLTGGSVIGNYYTGGLVGWNDGGTIDSSFNSGSVSSAYSYYIGGLVGYNNGAGALISDSYATGSVSGGLHVGGLAGYNSADAGIRSSYATGNVSGLSDIGGLVGTNYGAIQSSRATGAVSSTGGNFIGGLVGYNYGAVDDSYATGSVSSGQNIIGGLIGLNAASGTVTHSHATGSVSSSIDTVGGLVGWNDGGTISDSYADGDATGGDRTGGLVGYNNGAISDSHATGIVNGATYVGGLVGIHAYGPISDSYATGAVSGASLVGGLIGGNNGTVTGSYAAGGVHAAGDYAGGLVGGSAGAISGSYATGAVIGQNYVGGLLGINSYGTLDTSYATGSASGSNYVGGLTGFNSGVIDTSYAVGSASGNGNVGGLIGSNYADGGGTVSASYWNSDVAATGIGNGPLAGAVGLSGAQLQQHGSFASWDFAATWIVYDGFTDPLLRSFMTPLTVTANDATRVYDNTLYSGGAGVVYSSTPDAGLLGTLSYGGDAQGARNAGTYVIAPGGLYSTQHGYAIDFVSGTLMVNPAPLTVDGATVADKVFDGTAAAMLGGTATIAALAGDDVTLQGGIATFADQNVGIGKAVTVGGFTLSGADAGNYTLVQPTGLIADITPATLTYVAAASVLPVGQTPAGLSGTVTGFVAGDTLGGATSGTLTWTTAATAYSPPGRYTVSGGGLTAVNYVFTQAADNATALELQASAPARSVVAATAPLQASLLGLPAAVGRWAATPLPAGADTAATEADSGTAVNTTIDTIEGAQGPTLRTVNGGIRLPRHMAGLEE